MVVGLGNPGRDYEGSRHNIGFDVVDLLAERRRIRLKRSWRARALVGRGQLGREDLVLVKPLTFMNRSGSVLHPLMGQFGLGIDELIVVVDDADLEAGRLRVRKQGRAGNHNGMKSVIHDLGTERFVRVRVGVGGRPEEGGMVEHVLEPVSREERAVLDEAVIAAADAVEMALTEGIDRTMNRFNAAT